MNKVFVYDPTASDKLSQVRGIGRYLQILRESFGKSWIFTDNIKRISADSIFINPFFNFLQRPLTLKRIAQKQIAVIHDLIPLKYPRHFPAGIKGTAYILLNRLALKNYDLIITDSAASKKDIINILHVDEKKIKAIYPCLSKTFTNSEFRIQNSKSKNKILNSKLNSQFLILDSKFCLYVGDATWNKNLVNLAKAIKIANINCVFVGKVFENTPTLHPWQRELKEFLELTKNDRRFIFAGFVSNSQLIKLYQQAILNILPSRDEGFGFSYLEAANFSCPSLLSDIPVLKEISGGNALFCDPKNPQDIADKINEICFENVGVILKSPKNLRNKIGTAAKKRSQFFSPDKFKKEILSVI